MIIEITNQQKLKTLNLKKIRVFLNRVFDLLSSDKKIPKNQRVTGSTKASFLFCDNDFIVNLNKRFFKKSSATDVIAFPLGDELDPDYLGEVVVSVQEAAKAAREFGWSWQKEVSLYMVHGILHLIGYTDTTKSAKAIMEQKQRGIMDKIKAYNIV
jgi:probable rRNA maturation factor